MDTLEVNQILAVAIVTEPAMFPAQQEWKCAGDITNDFFAPIRPFPLAQNRTAEADVDKQRGSTISAVATAQHFPGRYR